MFLHMLGIAFRTIVAGMSADERAQAANAFTMAFVFARVVNLSGAADCPDRLNFDDWSDDDDVPVMLPGEETGIMDWLTQVELSSGRSDSGDSDDETGTQAT